MRRYLKAISERQMKMSKTFLGEAEIIFAKFDNFQSSAKNLVGGVSS